MTFRNRNDLLVYLLKLADSDRHGALITGQSLIQAMIEDHLIEHDSNEYDALARMIWALKREGSIDFRDTMAQQRGEHQEPGYNDFVQAANIEVTGPGRMAASISRPNISINQLALGNISNLDLTVLLTAMEDEVESLPGTEEEKAEARSRLQVLREAAQATASSAAGNVIAAALRQVLGFGP